MWTLFYKGSIIHGYCSTDNVQVQFVYGPTLEHRTRPWEYKSLHSAKCNIARFNKNHGIAA